MRVSNGDALIVFEKADGPTLDAMAPDAVTDDMLEDAWTSCHDLHDARIAHGRIELDGLVASDGRRGHHRSRPSPSRRAERRTVAVDVAELLVATALLVGTDRALDRGPHEHR